MADTPKRYWLCDCGNGPEDGDETLGQDGAIRCHCGRPLSGNPDHLRPDTPKEAIEPTEAGCKHCTRNGWYESFSGGVAHIVPCEYCNPQGRAALRTTPKAEGESAELVSDLRAIDEEAMYHAPASTYATCQQAADTLERLQAENTELRAERDALLEKPLNLAKLDSIDDLEGTPERMVAYYWWQKAQDAQADNDGLREASQTAIDALNAMMNAWFDYHDAHSLTRPVTGEAGNAFDKALAAREKLEALTRYGDRRCPQDTGASAEPTGLSPFGSSQQAVSPVPASIPSAAFQAGVDAWMDACFGDEIKADVQERCDRFIEEALEFVQAAGYSAERAHALVDYTFGRPEGEINQEVGGVMVTLAAMCNTVGVDIGAAAETELARVWTKIDKIRAKQAAKPTGSALPVASAIEARSGETVKQGSTEGESAVPKADAQGGAA